MLGGMDAIIGATVMRAAGWPFLSQTPLMGLGKKAKTVCQSMSFNAFRCERPVGTKMVQPAELISGERIDRGFQET